MSDDAVALYRAGALSPEVTLARLLLAGETPATIAARLAGEPDLDALRILARTCRDGLHRLAAMLAHVSHEEPDLDAIRRSFDLAVAHAPEASVAAYSLNDPAILAVATAELVGWLEDQGFLRADADVLDLGCGIGRVAAAIAPRVRAVLGLDVSPAMIAEAERRRSATNIRFQIGTGVDLGDLRDTSFDLVLAVDSFPYLIQAGVADDHVRDIARLLRLGGSCVIFNLSYRNDPNRDATDLERWVAKHELLITAGGIMPFKLWDGRGYIVGKS